MITSANNKIIPKDATMYCFNCLVEQPVREGEVKDGKLAIFCRVCQKQVSEMIYTTSGWKLHHCFYKSLFADKGKEK
jgi:hypothetical protein